MASVLLLLGLSQKLHAQEQTYKESLSDLVSKIQGLYYEALASNNNPEGYYDQVFFDQLITEFDEETFSIDALSELNLELIEALKADVGLNFYSSAVYNFEPGITDTEDLFYRSRVNAGIDWQVLNSGLVGNKRKIRELELQNRINALTKLQSKKESQYVYLYNYIIYLFNKRQLDYVNQRIELIQSFIDISGQMYLVRATRWEDIIELKNKKETLENINRNLTKYNEGFEKAYQNLKFDKNINVDKLPLLGLNSEKIFEGAHSDKIDQQLTELLEEQLSEKYNRNKDLSLRAYLRYNLYEDGDNNNQGIRTYSSVGATFTAPLFQNKRNKEIAKRELEVIEQNNNKRRQEVNNSLLNQYYEYEYVFKSYMEFFGNKGVVLERLRRELTKDDMKDFSFSPLNAIHQIDQIYAIETDLLDIKQNLYLKLLRIYTDMGLEDISEIGEEISLDGFFNKVQGDRSLFVWSKGFDQLSPQFLSNYIANNQFSKIYLSPGDVGESKTLEFLELERLRNIKMYRLIGENSYVIDGDFTGMLDIIEQVNGSSYQGIQLDVEPHTFDDWEVNRSLYLNRLVDLTKEARGALDDDKSVSLAIPNHYPESIIEDLAEWVDEIVVMSYESTDLEFVITKLEEERRVIEDQLIVAFRAKDFSNRVAMEEFILDFIKKTGIVQIAIHDLSHLIMLDQKTISGDQ